MSVFGSYSRYYNLLYQDKDNAGEAAYVDSLIRAHMPGALSILDLGCGTGRHCFLLAEKGYAVTGVDMSEAMLAVANAQASILIPHPSSLNFLQGDIRSIRLNRQFDVVTSLFHVMSYQTTNDDLAHAFETASMHLTPGGVFIFDCWYGPAVLTDRPTMRVKELEDGHLAITRTVEPVMYPNRNLVELHYRIVAREKEGGPVEEVQEVHRMRYLFYPEVERFAHDAGMSVITAAEWMTGREPGFDTWGVCFVVKKPMRDEG